MLSKLGGNAQKHHCRARSDSAAEVRALCMCGHLVLLVSQCLVTCGLECGKEGEMLTQVTTPPLPVLTGLREGSWDWQAAHATTHRSSNQNHYL